MKRPAILFAAGLVVLTNLATLGLAALNRSRVDATLTLTDRELGLITWDRESTATTVRLRWSYPVRETSNAGWFGCDRLTAIGFDCSVPASDARADVFYARQAHRNAFVVLEYDGPSWQAYEREAARLNARQVAQGGGLNADAFARSMAWHSRLIAIDAGPDPDALRRAYPDRSKYVVTAARVSITRIAGGRESPSYLRGNILNVLPDTLTVPRTFASGLRAEADSGIARPQGTPAYTITLNYGRRLEPWITEVKIAH